jgi:hypothetical protein
MTSLKGGSALRPVGDGVFTPANQTLVRAERRIRDMDA